MMVWRPVVGYEGTYEVSAAGEVRRLRRTRGARPGHRLIPLKHDRGYLGVSLSSGNRATRYYVHRLVAHAFLGAYPPAHQVNHRNGNKRDNRIENLEYVLARDNTRHAVRVGLMDHAGEKNSQAKLTAQQVGAIRALRGIMSRALIAQRFHIAPSTVSGIHSGARWRDHQRHPDVRTL